MRIMIVFISSQIPVLIVHNLIPFLAVINPRLVSKACLDCFCGEGCHTDESTRIMKS